ncbi:metal ABC transporter ATP-binding protein [Auraticoccus cholistanensis]|uniref:metal ABC transporter ATP-binding protein n=1 Tax=Auraticoccus cholistanensis TaxID=2656650 RepID=UPI0018D204EF|nr:ABC transporter ATP-binding protein [Auraticoccus cholistanensis]
MPQNPTAPEGAVVLARDVHVSLGGQPVLHGVSLTQPPGTVLALMGANGSGKTTLVRALLGLVPLQRGSVELFGTPVARFRRWSAIGYVPQRSSLTLRNATVGEVVASGRLGHRRPFLPRSRRDKEQADAALERVGLSGRQRDEMVHLSGGQQQRVLIARALAAEPQLLVMDEPLAGVDAENQQAIAEVVAGLVSDGLSATVVLHEMGPLAPLLSRAVVLADGRVSHDGPVSGVPATPGHETDELSPPDGGRAFLTQPVSPDHHHDDRGPH